MFFYRIQDPFFGSTTQLGSSLSSPVFLCYVPFPALFFPPCWYSLVGNVLKYYICLLYLNCLDLLTCFKPGNIDTKQRDYFMEDCSAFNAVLDVFSNGYHKFSGKSKCTSRVSGCLRFYATDLILNLCFLWILLEF